MITGTTVDNVSREMFKLTKKQAKALDKKLPSDIKGVYESVNDEKFNYYEPKKNNRWFVNFPKRLDIARWAVKSVTIPSYPFSYGDEISIVFRDPISPSISAKLLGLVDNYKGTSKEFNLEIQTVDPTGCPIEEWKLKDCIISSIFWDELNYDNDKETLIYVTLKYKYVKYKKI